MSRKMKFKNDDEFQFKNSANIIYKYDTKFKKLDSIIQDFLDFHPLLSEYDKKLYFVLNYNSQIPKTSRLLFLKESKLMLKKDLPWKKVRFSKAKTEILYGIEANDWNNFINELKIIKENKTIFSKENYDSAKTISKQIISKLTKFTVGEKPILDPNYSSGQMLRDFKKLINLDDETPMLVILIPLDREMWNKIVNEINISKDIIDFIENLNTLIIKKRGIDNILSSYPWIIKEYNSCEENGLVLRDEHIGLEVLNSFKKIKLNNPKMAKTIIGVIDSGTNLSGDFLKYLTFENHLESGKISWYTHGNRVTSLIIANDELNPTNQDGLGNFRVKHFEVIGMDQITNKRKVSFEHLIKKLPEFLEKNPEIKIWNLSIGKLRSENYKMSISPLGMFLDYLATKYDVLFIVASGNDGEQYGEFSLHSPADSFNSLSIGSCEPLMRKNGKQYINKTHYSSFGEVNGYLKPEICTFGGPNNLDFSKLRAMDVDGDSITSSEIRGTSFSTPRITRMAAWLYENGYKNILEIKAKIINSASRMTAKQKSSKYGYVDLATNKINQFDVTFMSKMENNQPIFYPLNLKNVDKISIASSIQINYDRALGDEYSLSDLEFDLYMIKKNWKKIKISKEGAPIKYPETPAAVKKPNKMQLIAKQIYSEQIGLLGEETLRTKENKYFSSKKKEYDMKKNKLLGDEWEYVIKFRRSDLIPNKKFELNQKPLEVSCIVDLVGNINSDEFYLNNTKAIEIITIDTEVDTEIEAETEI